MERGEIRLKNETVAAYPNYLITRGIPLPPGKVRQPEAVSICDAEGRVVPSAGKVLQHRPDGSIEWLLVDFLTDFTPEEKKSVFIELKPGVSPKIAHPVQVFDGVDQVRLTNGITDLTVSKTGGSLLRRLVMHDKELIGPTDLVDLEAVDMDGKIYRASVNKTLTVSMEHCNPLKTTVKIEGKHVARDGSTFLDFALRVWLTANRADVGFMHTFYNRQPNTGPLEVKAIRLIMPTRMDPTAKKLMHQANHGQEWWPRDIEVQENIEIVSASVSDVNHYGRDFKPYKQGATYLRNFSSFKENPGAYAFHMPLKGGSGEFRAEHMTGGVRRVYPFVGWQQSDMTLVFSLRYWSQLHPKALTIDENVLTLSIWPDWSTPMRVVQGVSKSHTFWITGEPRALDHEAIEHKALQWQIKDSVEPIEVSLDPAWPAYCEVADCQHLLRYQPQKYAKLENILTGAPGEPSRFTYARNVGTGMFNFGCAGGEGGFTNNEDDCRVYVPLLDYLRTGRAFLFDFGEETALHYMEVDFCEWSTEPRQLGGFIAHTIDHFIGCVYPSHQWAEGVLLYYYLTGDPRARSAVIQCGNNQVYWAENLLPQVCCDGREAGMPLVNLAAAYRLVRDPKYVKAAWIIINGFQKKWFDRWGDLKYPYPQGAHLMWTTGYGDWSSYYGLYRMYEVTGDEAIKTLLVSLLKKMMDPARFSVNDSRGMDFMAVWEYIHLTGDRSVLQQLKDPIDNFLQKGGHPTRRLHFLKVLDEEGWIKP